MRTRPNPALGAASPYSTRTRHDRYSMSTTATSAPIASAPPGDARLRLPHVFLAPAAD